MKNLTKKNTIVRAAVEAKVKKANLELAEITEQNFPFELKDVVLTVRENEAGIKVMSGSSDIVCVAEWPKRYDAEAEREVVKTINHEINETVKGIRIATEERESLPNTVREIESAGETSAKAIAAMKAAGMSDSEIGNIVPMADMTRGQNVYKAAEAAVRKANSGLAFDTIGSTRRYGEARMRIRRFPGGFVISAGGKPILATRWPKDDRVIAGMEAFVVEEIAAVAESRRAYFRHQQELASKSEMLAEKSEEMSHALAIAASL